MAGFGFSNKISLLTARGFPVGPDRALLLNFLMESYRRTHFPPFLRLRPSARPALAPQGSGCGRRGGAGAGRGAGPPALTSLCFPPAPRAPSARRVKRASLKTRYSRAPGSVCRVWDTGHSGARCHPSVATGASGARQLCKVFPRPRACAHLPQAWRPPETPAGAQAPVLSPGSLPPCGLSKSLHRADAGPPPPRLCVPGRAHRCPRATLSGHPRPHRWPAGFPPATQLGALSASVVIYTLPSTLGV